MFKKISFALGMKNKWDKLIDEINKGFRLTKQDMISNFFEVRQNREYILKQHKHINLLTNEIMKFRHEIEDLKKIALHRPQSYQEDYEISSPTPVLKESMAELKKTIPQAKYQTITNSERAVLSVLFDAEMPLSYEVIAHRLNISPNSAKVHINSLKRKGYPLETFQGPKKSKLYAIRNTEKIRQFYG